MNIEILFLDACNYNIKEKTFPIIVKLTSDITINISTKIDLKDIVLMKNDEDIIGSTYSCNLGTFNDVEKLSKNKPKYLLYDVYSGCEDIDLKPGNYDLFISLYVYEEVGEDEFKEHLLEARKSIAI